MNKRWYRRLLRILPLDFRADYGREMEQVFRDQHDEAAARGPSSVARVWLANVAAVLAIGPREHLAQLAQDVRYALRGMRAHPGFVIVALLMIALGTGANAAMFSVIDAVLLQSPFADPDRIAAVHVVSPDGRLTAGLAPAQYRSLLESEPALDAVGAFDVAQPILTGLGEPRRLSAECVTAGLFRVLGAAPLSGRTFTADEDRPGAPSVMVISYQFWQRELGGRVDAVGRVIDLNGVPTTIVGIMPRRFLGPLSRNDKAGWLPLGAGVGQASSAGCQVRSTINVFGRAAAGETVDSAAAKTAVSTGFERIAGPDGRTGWRLSLASLEEQTLSDVRTPLLILLGAVGLVLLVACANVANFQLERVFGRRQELAVRLALGATRGRILRQTLTENVLLYLFGGGAGFLLAGWTLHLIVGLMPGYVPHLNEIEVNSRILAATFAIACLAGVGVGLAPAIQATSPSLIDELRVSSRAATRGGGWTRPVLVAGQLALSLMLLVGAALMVRTFLTLRPADPGFSVRDKTVATVRLQRPAGPLSDPALLFDQLLERLRGVAGVQGITGTTYLVMSGSVGSANVTVGDTAREVLSGAVLPNYFAEIELPIVHGRAFDAHDAAGAPPVAIVNETMARREWPGGHALGATLTVRGAGGGGLPVVRQVVGVVRDTRTYGGDTRTRAELFVPYAQAPLPFLHLIIRGSSPGDPRLAAAVRTAVATLGPRQTADRITAYQTLLDNSVNQWRLGAWLLGLFAALALLLAAVGLASSIAWQVAQRRREIGVRMALGAAPGQVTRMLVRQGLTLATIGIVLGLAGAAASTRLLEAWLYGVTPLDPRTFALSAAGMLAIAALASYLPARRAARIDPLITLRSE